MKVYNDPSIGNRINENLWFKENQELLLGMANTTHGRELLCIPKDYPKIVEIGKCHLKATLGNGKYLYDFRVGAKWANVIRYKWEQFNSYARYFVTDNHSVVLSPLTKYSRSLVATTTTKYPDPDPETTTVDGRTGKGDSTNWATTQTSATGEAIRTLSNEASEISTRSRRVGTSTYEIHRGYFLFDTSSIDDAETINSATFSLYVLSTSDGDNDGQDYIALTSSSPASNTNLVDADYNDLGTTKYATDIDIGSISTSAYNDWTLNATGLAAISKTGVTKLGTREGHDIENATIADSSRNDIEHYFADQTGTTNDPKLVVVSSAAATIRLLSSTFVGT